MEPLLSNTKVSPAQQLHTALKAEQQQAFALLDAARTPGVLEWLTDAGLPYTMLYDGVSAENLAHAAPYLVQLDAQSSHTGHLLETSWGEAWGIYILSGSSLQELRRHFRRFLYVKLPDQRLVYFRFYDPRVLRDFLPGFSEGEKADFFGPVATFLLEDADHNILRFDRSC